jgi:hypothetical protein
MARRTVTADDRVTETPCSTVGNHTFCTEVCSCICHLGDDK